MNGAPGEWSPAEATRRINACAKGDLTILHTKHSKEQMMSRSLFMGDLTHLLKTGFVYDAPEPASREGYFKYVIEGATPNSEGRSVAAVVIPDGGCALKIVTMMWKDEK